MTNRLIILSLVDNKKGKFRCYVQKQGIEKNGSKYE